jgi:hypothetical protein
MGLPFVGVVLADAIASMALLGGSQAQERFCPQPRPPEPTRIERYIEARRTFGFRSDRAYVRKLVRRGSFAYDGWIPVTRSERRYLRLRERLTLGARAQRYLRRRPQVDGGTSIEDGWPREPYMLVRLTRDRAKHTRALRRRARFPDNLRTVRVPVSERALRRLQDRIDFDAHEPDGFHVKSTSVEIDTSTVDIGLITKRSDHAEYFRARYGPRVRTLVIATELTSPECAEIVGYDVAADGVTLTVRYASGGGATFDRYELVEYDDRVEIGIVEQGPNGPRTADYREGRATVVLSRPLGSRRVVDATTGRRVRPRAAAAVTPRSRRASRG